MARAKKMKVKQTGIISSPARFRDDNDAHFFYGDTTGMGDIVQKSSIGTVQDAIGRQRKKGSPFRWMSTTINDLQASQNWNETRPRGDIIRATSVKHQEASVIEFQMPNLGKCIIGAAFVQNEKTDELTGVAKHDIPCIVMTLKNAKGKQLTNKQFKHLLEMGTFTDIGFKPEFSEVLLAANTIADGGSPQEYRNYYRDDGYQETKTHKGAHLQKPGRGHQGNIYRRRSQYDRYTGRQKKKPDSIVKPWQRLLDTPLLKKRSWGLYALGSFTNNAATSVRQGYGAPIVWHADVPDRDYDKLTRVVKEIIDTCKSMTKDETEVIPAHLILEWASSEISRAVPGRKAKEDEKTPTGYFGGKPIYTQSQSKASTSTAWHNSEATLMGGQKVDKMQKLLEKWHPSKTGVLDDLNAKHKELVEERDRVKAIDEKFTAEIQALIDKKHEELKEESKEFIQKTAQFQRSLYELVEKEKEDYKKWLDGE